MVYTSNHALILLGSRDLKPEEYLSAVFGHS